METLKISPVLGNSQKLDGGAMFGHAPKALWQNWVEVDSQNRISLACRAMLIQTESKNILVETGIGNFFPEKLRQRYGVVEPEPILINNLKEKGLSHEDIHVVFLSHLHFDHAGGLIAGGFGGDLDLYFTNALYMVPAEHFKRAKEPHNRDKASFVPGLAEALENSGRLKLVEESELLNELPFASTFISNGHTPGLLLPTFSGENGSITFMGDLVPGTPWINLPICMGYDRFPELLIEEKEKFFDKILEIKKPNWLFYTHDYKFAFSKIEKNEKGKFQAVEKKSDEEILIL